MTFLFGKINTAFSFWFVNEHPHFYSPSQNSFDENDLNIWLIGKISMCRLLKPKKTIVLSSCVIQQLTLIIFVIKFLLIDRRMDVSRVGALWRDESQLSISCRQPRPVTWQVKSELKKTYLEKQFLLIYIF
jgi:hypothetical protein